MNKSEKSPERKDKTEQDKVLELEEMDAVTGGRPAFMSSGVCSDRAKSLCTGSPYTCNSKSDNKKLCTFG